MSEPEFFTLTEVPTHQQHHYDHEKAIELHGRYDMTGVEMFRQTPSAPPPSSSTPSTTKIPRKEENKVSKRNWRPGPQPTKPDNECTEDELNRRERRRASNRKAAQSARDRRVKKQEQLETQIEQYHAEQKRFDEQRKQWEEAETNYKQQIDQQASELREAKETISSLQHELFNVKKQQSPLQLLNSPCSTSDGSSSSRAVNGPTWEDVEQILGLHEFNDKTPEEKEVEKSINTMDLL